MIISHDRKFIFVHIYKVAGTSIKGALSDFLPWYQKVKYINYFSERIGDITNNSKYTPFFSKHAKAVEIKRRLPAEIYDSYFKFAFVRNPWDWQVSLYFYILKDKYHPRHNIVKSMKDFNEFVEWNINNDAKLQKNFLVDENGNLIVDYVGRYENLQEDFDEICSLIGIIKRQLPHNNRSKHRDYREYYNDYTRALVEETFKEDIEMFEYTFD